MKEDPCGNLVAGTLMLISGHAFLLRAKVLMEEELAKSSPNNALIDFICNAVRLWREINP